MGVYMLSLVGGEAFRCHRGDGVMSSFDWRKKLHRQLNSTLNSITLHIHGLGGYFYFYGSHLRRDEDGVRKCSILLG